MGLRHTGPFQLFRYFGSDSGRENCCFLCRGRIAAVSANGRAFLVPLFSRSPSVPSLRSGPVVHACGRTHYGAHFRPAAPGCLGSGSGNAQRVSRRRANRRLPVCKRAINQRRDRAALGLLQQRRPSPKTGCGSVCSAVRPTHWTSCPLTGPEIGAFCRS